MSAVIVAPATINTIDKFAAGIADTWALSTLIESMGYGAPIVFATNFLLVDRIDTIATLHGAAST